MINNYSLIKSLIFTSNHEGYVPVNGNSMWPLLKNGQRVKISLLKKPFKRGKCYLFIYNNSLYIHRLFKTKNGHALFIGDYSEKLEEVPLEAIIGELELSQNLITVFILNFLNHIFLNIFPGKITTQMRIRNRIFSVITKLEKKDYERKI